MSTFCLVPKLANKLKTMLKNGEIDIVKLSSMSSAERRAYFSDIFGERIAKEVNALFESKLLLKNQKLGLVNWAKQITGIKPEERRSLIDKINRMQDVLRNEDESSFLNDIVSKRLGVEVTQEEANKIASLSEAITSSEKYSDDVGRIAYGRNKIALTEYVNSLNPNKADILTNIAGAPRSIMASLDLSAPLNQGWGMLSRKQFYSSFKDMFKYLVSEDSLKDLQADIITRPGYKLAKKSGLRLTDVGDKLEMREEQFMSTLVDKIPGIAASQRAYTGFLNKLRMDVFDDLIKKADIAGEDVALGSKASEDIASMVNNFTGGARVGKAEGAVPALNALFFSPRKIVSTLNILNPVNYISSKISPTARKEALRNLIGSLSISASLVSFSGALTGEDQEKDPRSTRFGKIKVGDSNLDVTGGNGTYAILLSRLLSGETKNSKGELKELGNDYGQTSGYDLISSGIRYKLSPVASLFVDVFSGANAIGEEKTVTQSVTDRLKPMFVNSLYELIKDDSTGTLEKLFLGTGAVFGGGLNTYEPIKTKEQKKKKTVPFIE